MTPEPVSDRRVPSPLRLFLSVLVIVFCAEALVMLVLPRLLPHGAQPLTPVIDAAVLVLLSAPLLWWVVARPLQAALAEKASALAANETLFRELNHRVKNNLQMLCDMLFLQIDTLGQEKGAVLRDIYGRIYAIARLHEQLYQSMQGGRIDAGQYLGRLLKGFGALYANVPITLDASGEALLLDLDRAIHVGLIANELITNAVKHAFPGGRQGSVTVRLRRLGTALELQVHDNGVGLPPDFALEQPKSLGLRLVHILAKRLNATVHVASAGGATVTVTFAQQGSAPIGPDSA